MQAKKTIKWLRNDSGNHPQPFSVFGGTPFRTAPVPPGFPAGSRRGYSVVTRIRLCLLQPGFRLTEPFLCQRKFRRNLLFLRRDLLAERSRPRPELEDIIGGAEAEAEIFPAAAIRVPRPEIVQFRKFEFFFHVKTTLSAFIVPYLQRDRNGCWKCPPSKYTWHYLAYFQGRIFMIQ